MDVVPKMKIYRAIFVATIVAFNAANFGYLFGKIGFYSRYFFLILLVAATVLVSVSKQLKVPIGLFIAFYLFSLYALLTAFWTENFELTVLKWLIYVAISLSLLIGGIAAAKSPDDNPFWPLKWVFIPVVLISVVALLRGYGWFAGNFRGYSGNSNALGATVFLSSPWVLVELRRRWLHERDRGILLGLSAAAAVVLVASHSRAAMGGLFIATLFLGSSLRLGKKFVLAYALLVTLIGVYALRPSAYGAFYRSYVEKRSQAVLKSRSDQLGASWEAAKHGGMFGAGFGISIGQARYWNMQSFSEVSREKGNSMLGIVEEMGIVGFALYLALLYSTWRALRDLSNDSDPTSKFLYRLGVGFFLGAIFHSAFEAWFLSSGPDVSLYWATLGLLIGTLRLQSHQTHEGFTRLEAASRARLVAPPALPRK